MSLMYIHKQTWQFQVPYVQNSKRNGNPASEVSFNNRHSQCRNFSVAPVDMKRKVLFHDNFSLERSELKLSTKKTFYHFIAIVLNIVGGNYLVWQARPLICGGGRVWLLRVHGVVPVVCNDWCRECKCSTRAINIFSVHSAGRPQSSQ